MRELENASMRQTPIQAGDNAMKRLQELNTALVGEHPDHQLLATFIGSGGCYRGLIRQYDTLAGPNTYDQALTTARDEYMAISLTIPHFWNRISRKQMLKQATDNYVDAFAAKMMAYLDADTPAEILEMRQLPSMMQKTHFRDGEAMAAEDFIGNHAYLLMDTALQEHAARRALITQYRNEKWWKPVVANRYVRFFTAVGAFALATIPELRVLPIDHSWLPDDEAVHTVENIVKYASAAIFGIDGPELLRLRLLQRKHDQQTLLLKQRLASDTRLTDLALRLVYGSVRYGDNPSLPHPKGRHGTDSEEENLLRLDALDHEFDTLHNDPGNKPYTGSQALGYAARLLIERLMQITNIIDPKLSATDKKSCFAELCGDLLREDLARMQQGLTVSRLRKEIMKIVGAVPAMFFSQQLSMTNDAVTFARDSTKSVLGSSQKQLFAGDDVE